MKARLFPHLFLPAVLLLLILLLACQRADSMPTPEPASPLSSSAQTARPLTATERAAVAEFAKQHQAIGQEWVELRQDFDAWRSGLTECHPSAAQEALRDIAASFKEVTETARSLPRTTSTKELADLLIPAAEAEETSLRQLRDRWQPGNVSFFEAVELQRTAAIGAQNAAEDRSLELQEEFEEGPTQDELEEAEQFQELFEEIEDAWEDYHDDYGKLRRKETKLEVDEVIASYNALAEQLSAVIDSLAELESTDITADLLDTLEDAADDEFTSLTALIEALTDGSASPAPFGVGRVEKPAAPAAPAAPATGGAAPAAAPSAAPAQGDSGAGQAAAPAVLPPSTPAMPVNGSGMSPLHEELDDAFKASVTALAEVSQGIEEIVEDKSAEYLVDVMNFNRAYDRLLTKWESFHEDYDTWRETDGGCDRIPALEELDGFSRSAIGLASKTRDLPRNGYLLPVYSLLADAADQEAGAMRALYNSWRPFAIDAFAAVEQERTSADKLRQQANTALQELTTRP